MSMIEVTHDMKNSLLSRREIKCTFQGLSGRLKKLEAIDMITKQFNLEGKIVVPVLLKNDTGRPIVSGTFYVYDDEKLAKQHLKAAIFKRLEKAKAGPAKAEEAKEGPTEKKESKKEEKPAEKETKKKEEGKPKEAPAEKAEKKPKEEGKQAEKKEGKPKEESK
jgi:ribosomal protein S24E